MVIVRLSRYIPSLALAVSLALPLSPLLIFLPYPRFSRPSCPNLARFASFVSEANVSETTHIYIHYIYRYVG